MQFLLLGLAFVGLLAILWLAAAFGFGIWAVKETTRTMSEMVENSECIQSALENQVKSYEYALQDAYKRGETLRPPDQLQMLERARQTCK